MALNMRWPIKEIERPRNLDATKEVRWLVDHGHDIGRLATERAEEILLYPHAHRLRTLFTQLVGDYGRINTRRMGTRQINAYLKRLQAFATAVTEEFSGSMTPESGECRQYGALSIARGQPMPRRICRPELPMFVSTRQRQEPILDSSVNHLAVQIQIDKQHILDPAPTDCAVFRRAIYARCLAPNLHLVSF